MAYAEIALPYPHLDLAEQGIGGAFEAVNSQKNQEITARFRSRQVYNFIYD